MLSCDLARGQLREGRISCQTIRPRQIRVNSLHGQGIEEPGGRVVVEGTAEDGTIEAIRIDGASGFALGVQWHAEYGIRKRIRLIGYCSSSLARPFMTRR